ncbi:PTS sugar transporter subunit IIB [Pseudoflavonifractor sp. AF19-9AC]|uniref:PTS sugar transporter subunit IIB n=1 Tax=Pseudoflavonifractor sp. AF19-9AC TaxID=2292244 RepID=UPI000E4E5813|nr:PTS sugar transporter subunit IIB [Pseudoflavonifractor sp. AF19-9AC]RHR10668.1 PTS sugar transporter subunit IIB [Pseudoflavonifractor sp. AF19-9AC]
MKVLAVCGLGIGSSIILKINVGKVLDELGVKDYSLDVADIGSAQSIHFDLAVTSVELAGILSKNMKDEDKFRVLAISNFVDKNEMKEKVKACLEQLGV